MSVYIVVWFVMCWLAWLGFVGMVVLFSVECGLFLLRGLLLWI